MQLGKLLNFFEASPALSLLRSPNAPFVIDFLDQQFKHSGQISIAHSELIAAFQAYQDEIKESYPDKLPSKADVYLADWCSHHTRWLQRFLEAGSDEPVYQLTPHSEDVFLFLDRVLHQDLGFVGTESRLKMVIDSLEDLVVGASDDPQIRLEHLRAEERRIQEEISQIESEGQVSKYRPAQIRERFLTAVSLLKQLQGDFRAVEESFRGITAQVQQKQAGGNTTRGGILEFALDAEDVLKQEDQGVSFYEFVRLILSPAQTQRLEQIIQEVRMIPELKDFQEGIEVVRGMISVLQQEAEKVMRTNQKLSTTLRRLLDTQAHAERQRIAKLLQEIRGLAISQAANPPRENVGIQLEVDLEIESPFRRTFWVEPVLLDTVELTDYEVDENDRLSAFRQLAAMQRLNWSGMKKRIQEMTATNSAPTLGMLLETHPPESGVIEVLGYLQIANDDKDYLVNSDASEQVLIPPDQNCEKWLELTIPLVTFTQKNNLQRNSDAK